MNDQEEYKSLFSQEVLFGVFLKAKIKTESVKAILICLLDFRSRPEADIHTVHTIIPRIHHPTVGSSYGSVCQEQLIYSQWACGKKVIPGEGVASMLG